MGSVIHVELKLPAMTLNSELQETVDFIARTTGFADVIVQTTGILQFITEKCLSSKGQKLPSCSADLSATIYTSDLSATSTPAIYKIPRSQKLLNEYTKNKLPSTTGYLVQDIISSK